MISWDFVQTISNPKRNAHAYAALLSMVARPCDKDLSRNAATVGLLDQGYVAMVKAGPAEISRAAGSRDRQRAVEL
jgi:hypothetical protein